MRNIVFSIKYEEKTHQTHTQQTGSPCVKQSKHTDKQTNLQTQTKYEDYSLMMMMMMMMMMVMMMMMHTSIYSAVTPSWSPCYCSMLGALGKWRNNVRKKGII